MHAQAPGPARSLPNHGCCGSAQLEQVCSPGEVPGEADAAGCICAVPPARGGGEVDGDVLAPHVVHALEHAAGGEAQPQQGCDDPVLARCMCDVLEAQAH